MSLRRAKEQLKAVHGRILGAVVNQRHERDLRRPERDGLTRVPRAATVRLGGTGRAAAAVGVEVAEASLRRVRHVGRRALDGLTGVPRAAMARLGGAGRAVAALGAGAAEAGLRPVRSVGHHALAGLSRVPRAAIRVGDAGRDTATAWASRLRAASQAVTALSVRVGETSQRQLGHAGRRALSGLVRRVPEVGVRCERRGPCHGGAGYPSRRGESAPAPPRGAGRTERAVPRAPGGGSPRRRRPCARGSGSRSRRGESTAAASRRAPCAERAVRRVPGVGVSSERRGSCHGGLGFPSRRDGSTAAASRRAPCAERAVRRVPGVGVSSERRGSCHGGLGFPSRRDRSTAAASRRAPCAERAVRRVPGGGSCGQRGPCRGHAIRRGCRGEAPPARSCGVPRAGGAGRRFRGVGGSSWRHGPEDGQSGYRACRDRPTPARPPARSSAADLDDDGVERIRHRAGPGARRDRSRQPARGVPRPAPSGRRQSLRSTADRAVCAVCAGGVPARTVEGASRGGSTSVR